MGWESTVTRRLQLVPLLWRRPEEFGERIVDSVDLRLDRRHHPRQSYTTLDWQDAASILRDRFPEIDTLLSESGLREIESAVRREIERTERQWLAKNTGDISMGQCLYAICRALKPSLVVETGVAYGMSSAFILQALAINGYGALESIDLPPLTTEQEDPIGRLVPHSLKDRWHLHRGNSRRLLASIVTGRRVDLFLHDSLHTYRTMRREFATVWPVLRSGGVLIADDVQGNDAFAELQRRVGFSCVIRQVAKPSLFGVLAK